MADEAPEGMSLIENGEAHTVFKSQLIELLKASGVPSLDLCAMLSQMAGQTAAHAVAYEGWSPQQALDTVAANSGTSFEDMLDTIGFEPEGCGTCPACVAHNQFKVN